MTVARHVHKQKVQLQQRVKELIQAVLKENLGFDEVNSKVRGEFENQEEMKIHEERAFDARRFDKEDRTPEQIKAIEDLVQKQDRLRYVLKVFKKQWMALTAVTPTETTVETVTAVAKQPVTETPNQEEPVTVTVAVATEVSAPAAAAEPPAPSTDQNYWNPEEEAPNADTSKEMEGEDEDDEEEKEEEEEEEEPEVEGTGPVHHGSDPDYDPNEDPEAGEETKTRSNRLRRRSGLRFFTRIVTAGGEIPDPPKSAVSSSTWKIPKRLWTL